MYTYSLCVRVDFGKTGERVRRSQVDRAGRSSITCLPTCHGAGGCPGKNSVRFSPALSNPWATENTPFTAQRVRRSPGASVTILRHRAMPAPKAESAASRRKQRQLSPGAQKVGSRSTLPKDHQPLVRQNANVVKWKRLAPVGILLRGKKSHTASPLRTTHQFGKRESNPIPVTKHSIGFWEKVPDIPTWQPAQTGNQPTWQAWNMA